MCGIAGIASLGAAGPPAREQLAAMSAALVHRGPDEEGIDLAEGVGLAARRLSIIDLATGQQPLFNEDRTVRAVFNGEIYNFQALRNDLLDRGHRFRSATDGEVIVHLWEEYGADFATHLNGMFALALHDLGQRRLVLARDRIGIKPLFWCVTSRYLVFGSEIKALLASGLVPRDLDLDGLGQFLSWEYVPAPGTLFRGIRKLEPGHLMELDLSGGTYRQQRWWQLPAAGGGGETAGKGNPGSEGEWIEAIDAKIAECVRRQLVSDVPLGAFLSGGVDSSLVVHGMGEARAFSIGFDDPTYDESRWATKVARHLGVSHRLEVLEPRAGDLFDHLMGFMEDPIGDFSIFPTYLVSRLAREEVTVALSGDGGDELFGGYETLVAQQAAGAWRRLPGPLRRLTQVAVGRLRPRPRKKGLVNKAIRFVEGLKHGEALGHARWRLFVGEALRQELFTPDANGALETGVGDHIERLLHEAGRRPELDRQLYADLRSYLVDNCLVKADRMSMACSLEVRVPLLDHELVELAFRMPPQLKVRRGRTKWLLKKVAARHVPGECVYRPKEGFSMPIKDWLRRDLRPLLEELLAPDALRRQGIFRPAAVERLIGQHLRAEANHSHVLWTLMVFQDWQRRWRVG